MGDTITFTIRIPESDHDLLGRLADFHGKTVAQLTRELLGEGIRRLLNPEDIERRFDTERERLLTAAKQLREDTDSTRTDTT